MIRTLCCVAAAFATAALATGCATNQPQPTASEKADQAGGAQWTIQWDNARALGVTETDIHRAIDRFHQEHRGQKVRNDWIEKLEIVTQTGKTVRFNEIADFTYTPDDSVKRRMVWID